MSFLPEPDPLLLAFFFFKKFVYLEVLLGLALLRSVVGRGPSRWVAVVALILAVFGVAITFAPMAGLNTGPVYVSGAQALAYSGGMTALLIPSGLMVLSALLPLPRWRWIDLVHLVLLVVLLALGWWFG